MPETNPKWQRYWRQLRKNYPDFPKSFFYAQLTALPAIGEKTAKALFDAGFQTSAEVLAAEDAALLKVSGVGKGLVAKLRAL